jgi:hypothetical protein
MGGRISESLKGERLGKGNKKLWVQKGMMSSVLMSSHHVGYVVKWGKGVATRICWI